MPAGSIARIMSKAREVSFRDYIFRIVLALGVVVTGGRLILDSMGMSVCQDHSCRVVESVLTLGPDLLSAAGFVFFLSLFVASFFLHHAWLRRWVAIVLLAGAVAEGMLLGTQLFLAGELCIFCISVLGLVVLSTWVFDPVWGLAALLFMSVELGVMASMDFKAAISRGLSLDQGTYGVKSCSQPARSAYLIFSRSCPHCIRVLEALEGCTACEIKFNPIEEIPEELLPGVAKVEGYEPGVNRLFLGLVNIDVIPVLVERSEGRLEIITGERAILDFLQERCFCDRHGEALSPLEQGGFDMDLGIGDEGVCSQQEACGE